LGPAGVGCDPLLHPQSPTGGCSPGGAKRVFWGGGWGFPAENSGLGLADRLRVPSHRRWWRTPCRGRVLVQPGARRREPGWLRRVCGCVGGRAGLWLGHQPESCQPGTSGLSPAAPGWEFGRSAGRKDDALAACEPRGLAPAAVWWLGSDPARAWLAWHGINGGVSSLGSALPRACVGACVKRAFCIFQWSRLI